MTVENKRAVTESEVIREVGEHGDTGIPQAVEYTPEYFVGRRTRRLREVRGWSQGELGRKLAGYGFDMHQTTVAKLESGARPIRLNEVAALAELFGVPVEDMYAGSGDDGGLLNQTELAQRLRYVRSLEALVHDAQAQVHALTAESASVAAQLETARDYLARLSDELGQAEEDLRRVTRG